jgi:hypothetical protein
MMEMLTCNKCCHEQFIVVAVLSGIVLLSAGSRVSDDVKDTVQCVSVRAMYGIHIHIHICITCACVRSQDRSVGTATG